MFLWFVSYVFVTCFFAGSIVFLSKKTFPNGEQKTPVITRSFLHKNIEMLRIRNERDYNRMAKVRNERETNAQTRTKWLG